MDEKEKYLNNLKKELDIYKKKLSEIKKDFKGKTGENVDSISHSLQSILKEATVAYDKLQSASIAEWKPMKDAADQAVAHLKGSFNELLSSSSEKIKECVTKTGKQCHEQLDCAAEYIREHPVKSILLAAGLGLLIGKIFK